MKYRILFLLLGAYLSSQAQQRMLTMEEATLGKGGSLAPAYLAAWQFRTGTANYAYVKDSKELVTATAGKYKETTLLTLEELNRIIQATGVENLKRFPAHQWISANEIRIQTSRQSIIVDAVNKKVTGRFTFPEFYSNPTFAPDNQSASCTVGANIYLVKKDLAATAITSDTLPGIDNGSDYVHRQEFGIHSGMFWSPKSNYLAYYYRNETMVAEYPLVNPFARIAEAAMIRYPMAGETSEQVLVKIYSVATGKTVTVATSGAPDQFLTNIAWDPTEEYLYIAVVNRAQNHMQFNKYKVSDGSWVATLFEEKHDKYVEPENPALFLNDGSGNFIWQSERDGYNHLYLYSNTGEKLKQLTSGAWIVTAVLGQDAKGSTLYYMSTENSPLERHLYRLNVATGERFAVTTEGGVHSTKIASDGKWVLDTWSAISVPNVQQVISMDAKKKEILLNAPNPLAGIQMPEMELVELTAADGQTKLYGRIIKPFENARTAACPTIVYVYGGPHLQMITNSWLGGGGLWDYYMAQQGYVVFSLDNRGSANRGLEFENVIHRHLGQAEMADQMKGIDYLKTLSFVDENRIGVYGWSFGGFMTTSLMTSHPEIFKVGVAGGPVIDWKFYEVMYGERYMDTPQENPEGYAQTELTGKAASLQGHLLMIHGAQDNVVVQQHSLNFIQACIDQNVPVDYFVYPTAEHNVFGPNRVHLLQKITDYFDTYLK